MAYEVRTFDLSGVQGLSKKAIDLHLGLYKTYVEQLNKLLEQLRQCGVEADIVLEPSRRDSAMAVNRVRMAPWSRHYMRTTAISLAGVPRWRLWRRPAGSAGC